MEREEVIKQLQAPNIKFSRKSNTDRLCRLLKKQNKKVTKGVKAFRLANGKLYTGGIGGSILTEFEVGKTYTVSGRPMLCQNGFHFFRETDACFGIDFFRGLSGETVFHEIEAFGEIAYDNYKYACTTIKIGKRIKIPTDSKHNSGNQNSGSYNSGNWNSGDYNRGNRNTGSNNLGDYNSSNSNSGNYNSGSHNSGHHNSGDNNSGGWNSCNFETGYLNSEQSEIIRVFNKPCKRATWNLARKPNFLYFYIEKDETYKAAFQRSWNSLSKEEKDKQYQLLINLPNFDWEVFTKISGIKKPK